MSAENGNATEGKPNFLFILTDQFHPGCLGYAGHPVVRTPNIDAIAGAGVTFTRAYSNAPLSMPARATLFTGLTPRGHRVRMNGIPLDESIPTFTEALRQGGYHTHCCGKIHLQPGNGAGWEDRSRWLSGEITDLPSPYYGLESVDFFGGCAHGTYGHYLHWLEAEHPEAVELLTNRVALEQPSPAAELYNRNSYKWALPANLHPAAWTADRTIDFLKSAGSDRPFCLMCSIQEPHPPFAPPAPYCHSYDPADVPPPVGREGELDDLPPHFRAMIETDVVTSGNPGEPMELTAPYRSECAAHYYGLIEMVDDHVGRVMAALQETGLERDTVVIFLADHGEALGDHGLWGKGPYHFDSVIRIPLLVSWPGRTTPGTVHDGPVSLLDIAPTILDIAGIPVPEGPTSEPPEAPPAPPAWPGRSLLPVLTGEDTNTDTDALVEMDEDYLGFKMRTLVTRRYRLTVYSGQDYGELFDLQEDPDECHNLWSDPGARETREELRARLLDRIMQTDISTPRQVSRA
jgi:arylsulfatase A-like enzyme